MSVIDLETRIAAPLERCFDLSRSVDLHMRSLSSSGEAGLSPKTSPATILRGRRLLAERNRTIQAVAESEEWRRFLPSGTSERSI